MYSTNSPINYSDPSGRTLTESGILNLGAVRKAAVVTAIAVGVIVLYGAIGEILEDTETASEAFQRIAQQHYNQNQPTPAVTVFPPPVPWRPTLPSQTTPQPTPGLRITLYRAIDSVELSVVMSTGTYGFSPHGGGKYFAFTLAGVINFAKSDFNAKKDMTVTSTDVPEDFLSKGYLFNDVGAAGPSIHFSDAVLPELYLIMSPIKILGSP